MRQRKMFIFMCKLYVCITVNNKDWFDLALFDLNGYHCTAVLQKVLFKWVSLYTSKDWLLFKVSLRFLGTGFLELLFLNKPHRSWLGSRRQVVQKYIYILLLFCFRWGNREDCDCKWLLQCCSWRWANDYCLVCFIVVL